MTSSTEAKQCSSLILSLRLEQVSFCFDSLSPLFQQVTLELPTHKTVFLSGPIGHGQSTLLKILAGLIVPQSGSYLINGYDVAQMTFHEFLPLRTRIGYSFDYGGLLANQTLKQNLVLPLVYHKVCSPDEAAERVQTLANKFDFEKQAELRPANVSGGLRKLVCVLRAFMLSPEMVILDDPFTGLDTKSAEMIIELLDLQKNEGLLRHVFITSRSAEWLKCLGPVEELKLMNGAFTWENSNKRLVDLKTA